MQMPKRLLPLIEYGVIDSVVRSLLSGKEAQVFLVESGGELRAAKVYKDQTARSFRNRAGYTEGRRVRNSRDQRAMEKGSRHGRERAEATWITAEVETIYKLNDAGVRVPKPHAFIDGVLVMECIEGPDGGPAPRLADIDFPPAQAAVIFEQLIREVVKMLCAGVVHGDLSTFNVLIEKDGPVIIDFPQAVDAAGNANARKILIRDVANLTRHFKRGRPSSELRYAYEMWDLYDRGELRPDTELTGRFELPSHEVDAELLLMQMREIEEDEVLDAQAIDLDFDAAPLREEPEEDPEPEFVLPGRRVVAGNMKPRPAPKPAKAKPAADATPAADTDAGPKRRRRRRSRGRRGKSGDANNGGGDKQPRAAGGKNKPGGSKKD